MVVTVGPNPHHPPTGGYHIFEGDGCVSCVRMRGGRASYAFAHLETEKFLAEKRMGRSPNLSLMAMRGYSGLSLVILNVLRQRLRPGMYSQSAANTNIDTHGGRVFALWEQALPYELALSKDGCVVRSKGQLKVNGFKGAFSAHPVAHPDNGNWYSVSYTPQGEYPASVVVLDSENRLVRVVPLSLGRKPMIHDAAITKRYVVVLDFPLLFTPEDILKLEGSLIRNHADKPARIGLLPVDGAHESEIRWYEIPSAIVFHALNAYDAPDGSVVLHLCQKQEFDIFRAFDFDPTSRLVRYDLMPDGTSRQTVEEMSLEGTFGTRTFVDFPFVVKHLDGVQARVAWFTVFSDRGDGVLRNAGVCKYDLESQKLLGAVQFSGHGMGEAALALCPEATEEDDGYVCVPVRDDATERTAMHVYDAQTMSDTPLARVLVPEGFHVPSGFHTQFLSGETLARL